MEIMEQTMKKCSKKVLIRRVAVLAVCFAVFMLLGTAVSAAETTVVTEATTIKGIDWGHGVTTDVVLEWAGKIGISMAIIFGLAGVAVGLVSEKNK